MEKNTIIQELREWHAAILSAQARPFLEPFGLTIRFDADAFDEDELLATDCVALYKGGSVFEKEIRYWLNYEVMADFFIRENDCSQNAYKEQMHITIFHVIGSALIEMFSDWYGEGDKDFDALVDNLPAGTLRSFLQGRGYLKQKSALSEEFAVCHQDNRETDSDLYCFCMQYLSQNFGEPNQNDTNTARIKSYRQCDRFLDAALVRRLLDEEHLMKNGESDGFRLQLHFGWYVTLRKEDRPQVAPFKYIVEAYCLDNIQQFSRRYVSMEKALLHCLNGFNENASIPDKYKSIQDYLSKHTESW